MGRAVSFIGRAPACRRLVARSASATKVAAKRRMAGKGRSPEAHSQGLGTATSPQDGCVPA